MTKYSRRCAASESAMCVHRKECARMRTQDKWSFVWLISLLFNHFLFTVNHCFWRIMMFWFSINRFVTLVPAQAFHDKLVYRPPSLSSVGRGLWWQTPRSHASTLLLSFTVTVMHSDFLFYLTIALKLNAFASDLNLSGSLFNDMLFD